MGNLPGIGHFDWPRRTKDGTIVILEQEPCDSDSHHYVNHINVGLALNLPVLFPDEVTKETGFFGHCLNSSTIGNTYAFHWISEASKSFAETVLPRNVGILLDRLWNGSYSIERSSPDYLRIRITIETREALEIFYPTRFMESIVKTLRLPHWRWSEIAYRSKEMVLDLICQNQK